MSNPFVGAFIGFGPFGWSALGFVQEPSTDQFVIIRVPVDRNVIRVKEGDNLLIRDLTGSITGGGVANKTPIVVDYLQSKIVIGDKLPVE